MNSLNNNESVQNDIISNTNNDSTKNLCENTGKISGIYKIINKVDGKYYIGRSNDLSDKFGRWYEHKLALIKNKHFNKHLQSAWNKYGEISFEFVIVETSTTSRLLEVEQKYLDIAKTHTDQCYNLSFDSRGGVNWTDENRKIRSEKIKGKNNPNYGNGLTIKGNKNPFFGKKHTKETKIMMCKNHTDFSGNRNPSFKTKTFFLKNITTDETFVGTQFKFYKSFDNLRPSGVSMLINGHKKLYKGWMLINQLEDNSDNQTVHIEDTPIL